MSEQPKIKITQDDYESIINLIERLPSPQRDIVQGLSDELDRAEVVPTDEGDSNFVSMYSKVDYKNLDTDETRTIELTFPKDANIEADKISILSPIGTALLGLKVGQTISWPVPNGLVRKILIQKITPSPQSAKNI